MTTEPNARSTPPFVVLKGLNQVSTWGLRLIGLALFCVYGWGLIKVWTILSPRLPDQFPIGLANHSFVIKNIHQKLSDMALAMLLVMPFVFYVEWLMLGWSRSSLRRVIAALSPSIRMDIGGVLADQLQIMRILSKILTFGLSASFGIWIHDRLSQALGFSIGFSGAGYAGQVLIFFIIYTFFDYWTHRVNHAKGFWPLHRYHHSTEDFCVITALRQHPAAFASIFMINLPLAILGAPVEVMITINLGVTIIGMIIHSGIDSDWGWFGRYVIQSPLHHRKHHILEKAQWGTNYAIMPIWDHLFGTYAAPALPEDPIGVDTAYNQGFGFWKDLVRDYLDFGMAVLAPIRDWVKRASPAISDHHETRP